VFWQSAYSIIQTVRKYTNCTQIYELYAKLQLFGNTINHHLGIVLPYFSIKDVIYEDDFSSKTAYQEFPNKALATIDAALAQSTGEYFVTVLDAVSQFIGGPFAIVDEKTIQLVASFAVPTA